MQQFLNITKALSDEGRVRVMLALREGELCVCQIIEMLGLAPSTVSKHMMILVQSGLILCRKEGKWHYYRLSDRDSCPEARATLDWLDTMLEKSSIASEDKKHLKCIRKMGMKEVCECYRS